jgi:hypothetical protein
MFVIGDSKVHSYAKGGKPAFPTNRMAPWKDSVQNPGVIVTEGSASVVSALQ